MLKAVLLLGVLMIGSSFSPSSPYTYYSPYFMLRADLEKSVKYLDSPQEMLNPGKLYVKGDRIYVNEKYKGVHVIDNTDPTDPKKISFIMAPGCLDMAIKGDILYIDNSVDLVAFSLETKKEVSRVKERLPEPMSPRGDRPEYVTREEGYILVGWRERER